jgi:methyltransferase (TIGR00027 family)
LVEQAQPPRYRQFNDPVVGGLLDPMLTMMAQMGPMRDQLLAALGPGTYGAQVMRTRYIDDVVSDRVEAGISQLVILGAGLDTRAYRMASLAATTVFDVDRPGTQRYKLKKLRRTPPRARDVRFVPTDFNLHSLGEVLTAAGLDHQRPVMFVWEGVTQYLTEAAVRSTLSLVGESAPGSTIVLTYILRRVIADGSWGEGDVRDLLGSSEPWRFGLEPTQLRAFLGEFGLELVEDVGEAEYQARYLNPIWRQLPVNHIERVAVATVLPGFTRLAG